MTTVEDSHGALAASGGAQVEARGYWAQVWLRFKKDKLAVASLGVIVMLFAVAFIGAPITERLVGHGPNTLYNGAFDPVTSLPVGPWTWVDTRPYEGAAGDFPKTLFIFGADQIGRDLTLRLMYGARTSLEVAVLATTFSILLGVIAGLFAGLYRGWVDTVLSRLIEIVMVFPALLFIIAVRQAFGDSLNSITFGGLLPRGVMTLVIIFSVLGWFFPARLVRGQVLSLREKEFIEAARMTGAGDFRIMRSHLLPHLVAPVVVLFSIAVASTIIGEAGLSFLGLGIEPPTPSWGTLLGEAAQFYLRQPWYMVWPGLSILFATLAFNLIGDALRDAFDPRGVS